MALTTIQKLKLWLGIADAVTTYDARLTQLLAAVEAAVESFCGREFAAESGTVVLDGNGRASLSLPRYPIVSVSSVKIDTEGEFGTGTEVDLADVIIKNDAGILVRRGGAVWPDAPQSIQVVYNGGLSSIPADLQQAVCEACADRWTRSRQLESGAPGQMSTFENINGLGSSAFANEVSQDCPFPTSVERLLRSKYRAKF